MKKRSLILATALLTSLLSVNAFADETAEGEDEDEVVIVLPPEEASDAGTEASTEAAE